MKNSKKEIARRKLLREIIAEYEKINSTQLAYSLKFNIGGNANVVRWGNKEYWIDGLLVAGIQII